MSHSPMHKKVKVAFLICDQPHEKTLKKHGGFDDLLHNTLEPLIKEEHEHLDLEVKGYDVVYKREYPSREELENTDAVMISGSFVEDASADLPWIARLCGFMIYLYDEFPRIRLIGICFGHQILARAFGARCEPNELGWEIGSTELTLTEEGKKILGTPGKPEDKLRIQQVHSDHVTSVPEGFHLLASSEKCKIQSLCKYYADEDLKEGLPPAFTHDTPLPPKPYSLVHILTTQGHPEWGHEVINPLVDEFLQDGKIDKELAEAAKVNAQRPDDSEKFGRAVMRVLGVARRETHEIGEKLGTAV